MSEQTPATGPAGAPPDAEPGRRPPQDDAPPPMDGSGPQELEDDEL